MAADYGWAAAHFRYFWGVHLHGGFAPDGTARSLELASLKRDEREVGLELLARSLQGGETVVREKGYAGRAFARGVQELGATFVRPRRKDKPGEALRPSRALVGYCA